MRSGLWRTIDRADDRVLTIVALADLYSTSPKHERIRLGHTYRANIRTT